MHSVSCQSTISRLLFKRTRKTGWIASGLGTWFSSFTSEQRTIFIRSALRLLRCRQGCVPEQTFFWTRVQVGVRRSRSFNFGSLQPSVMYNEKRCLRVCDSLLIPRAFVVNIFLWDSTISVRVQSHVVEGSKPSGSRCIRPPNISLPSLCTEVREFCHHILREGAS